MIMNLDEDEARDAFREAEPADVASQSQLQTLAMPG